jgi:CDP-glucose 4,6-dehydratase
MSDGWLDRPVLVTGATGVVGSWLVKELLGQGADVVGLVVDEDPRSELVRSGDIRRITVVHGRLEDYSLIERAISVYGVGNVIHLGAQTLVEVAHRSPLITLEANVRGTYHVLEACRVLSRLVQRVVIASSDKAYGTRPDLPYREDMAVAAGSNVYDVSKSCTDLIAGTYAAAYDLPVSIARCGNIYGGGDVNWSRIVPGTIRSLLRKEAPRIRSNGRLIRDYLYVKDAVAGYLAIAARADEPGVRGEAFNFSSDSPMSVVDMVKTIRRLMDCEAIEPDVADRAVGEIDEQWLSSAKAGEVLGWSTAFGLDESLLDTISWYRDLPL